MTPPRAISVFAGFRFPPEVISLAVRWYLRYGLSYRDVEMSCGPTGGTWPPPGVSSPGRFAPARSRSRSRPTARLSPPGPRRADPSALHTTERYANNPIEADHGRLKARLRPMRGLKRRCSARILATGHTFVQNLRRGHYDIATEATSRHTLRVAFDDLARAI